GDKDFVVTGAATVTINGKPAARVGSRLVRQGMVVAGSPNVVIGGPAVGGTLGRVDDGTAACVAAQDTRWTPGRPMQSWSNCGTEVPRMLVNARRKQLGLPPVPENLFLADAIKRGLASGSMVPEKVDDAGGTKPEQREQLLNEAGVAVDRVEGTMDNLVLAAASGRSVLVDVWAGSLWPPPSQYRPGEGKHVVLVTGVEFDADGKLVGVIVNDTGRPYQCGTVYPAARLEGALQQGHSHLVTRQPMW
ncbi:MAG: PAAR domain-containing protein, partial [Polyangiaceae bacterium]|nr:PAAR domain-containing protein [Polyangiaceae bacterium]